jgi:hypothetical protein
VAVLALLCSALATIGNFAIARDFPDFKLDPQSWFLLDSDTELRFMRYRVTTNLFYHQALVLWAVLGLLLGGNLLLGL